MTRYTPEKRRCPLCGNVGTLTVNKSIMKRDRMSVGYRCTSCKKRWSEKR